MRKLNIASSFNDMLFNILIGFFFLFMLAFIMINPVSKKHDVELKAEYLITAEWPNGNKDDIDLIVITPDKKIVFYGRPNVAMASLDRDDRGALNDTIRLSDGTIIKVEENWERVSVRKMAKGEYIVNIKAYTHVNREPTPVKVKVEKLNPYRVIYSDTVVIKKAKQEETAIRFTLNNKGEVIETSTVKINARQFLRRRR